MWDTFNLTIFGSCPILVLFETIISPKILFQPLIKDKWSTSSFRMFSGGSLWKPPVPNIFTSGMPEELLDEQGALRDPKDEVEVKPRDSRDERPEKPEKKEKGPPPPGKRALSDKQRDHLEEMLRSLLPDR